MRRLLTWCVATVALGLFLLGCGGGGSDPIGGIPDSTTGPANLGPTADHTNHSLWGLWHCFMEPGSDRIKAVPLRSAAFTANVNTLLEGSPGNLLIEDLDLTDFLTDGRLDCTVTLKHPMPGLDQFHGFDVWGAFLHNGASALSYDTLTYSGGPAAGDDEAILLNADGYTRWFNYPEFDGDSLPILEYLPGKLSNLPTPTATLNPFKIFADGLDVDEDYHEWITTPGNADDRGIYRAGQVNSRRYELQFPTTVTPPKVEFQYAVIATWEPGDPTLTGQPNEYDPFDFPVSANCDEAFFVHADTSESTLYNDGTSAGGSFVAAVEVFDWQGGIVCENGITEEVERIIIEGDFLPGGSQEYTQVELAMLASAGTENSSVFQVEIAGCSPESAGETDFWVIVESAGLNGESYDQGFPTEFPPDAHRAAFLRGTVEVGVTSTMGLTVVSIDPDHAPFWSYVDDAVITGTEFEDGATAELRKDGEDPVVASDVLWLNATSLQCDFDLAGADSGLWDVVVLNPSLEEGILEDGFTIDPWSEEWLIEENSYRLPALAERMSGPIILAAGRNNSTTQYMIFDPAAPSGDGWEGPYLLANIAGNNIMGSLASDPTSDTIYYASGPQPYYRYQGGTAPWETAFNPIFGCRTLAVTVDQQGRPHIIDNSMYAFGWIIHCRATAWGVPFSGWDINGDYFADAFNECVLNEGNIIDYDSAGNMYVIYNKDRALNPYVPGVGPKFIRVTPLPGAGWSSGYSSIEQSWDTALDSPALTCDPDDVLHAAYRRLDPGTSDWQICYERSTNGGSSWNPDADIWEGVTEPGDGYVFLISDSEGNLHALYIVEEFFEYKNSPDGAAWSDVEFANPSASGLPPGIEDFTPKVIITSDGIMHVAWIRGDPASGYGDLYHRMRDLY